MLAWDELEVRRAGGDGNGLTMLLDRSSRWAGAGFTMMGLAKVELDSVAIVGKGGLDCDEGSRDIRLTPARNLPPCCVTATIEVEVHN